MKAPEAEIVIVAGNEGRGAIQPHVDKLVPSLVRHGYAVTFLGWDRTSKWPRRMHHDGVKYEMLFRGGGYASRWLALWTPVWYLVAAIRLLLRRRSGAEVWMGISFEGALPLALASLIRPTVYIYNCRDNMTLRSSFPRAVQWLVEAVEGLVMRRADTVIFPDENRIPPDATSMRVSIIRNCAPEVIIEAVPPSAGVTIYAMGYLRESRGIGLLLDAAAEVEGCRVIVAGKCPEPRLEHRLATSPHVDYRGQLSPTDALLVCGEANLIFTFYKPTSEINLRAISNKWSDAMMAARPIVINQEVYKAEWIMAEGIGYLCPYDAQALAGVLEHVRDNPQEAAEKGTRGRLLWEQGYRWDIMEARVLAMLEEVSRRARIGTSVLTNPS